MQPNAEVQVREVAQGQVVVCIILSGAVWWGKLVLELVSGAVIIRSIALRDWHGRNTRDACQRCYTCG